jgi:hypothetical protein
MTRDRQAISGWSVRERGSPDTVIGITFRARKGATLMLDEGELAMLEAACRNVPIVEHDEVATDYVAALLDTVMDYQNSPTAVDRAGKHFAEHRSSEIRTLEDLEDTLAAFQSDKGGNDRLAMHLWGYHHWRRAQELRGLVAYFRDRDLTDLHELRSWAATSTPEDFVGAIKGLGPTVYQGLLLRLGVDTVKPDVHLLRFVANAVGRPVGEPETVGALEQIAVRLGVRPRTLDWSIWELQRATPTA